MLEFYDITMLRSSQYSITRIKAKKITTRSSLPRCMHLHCNKMIVTNIKTTSVGLNTITKTDILLPKSICSTNFLLKEHIQH